MMGQMPEKMLGKYQVCVIRPQASQNRSFKRLSVLKSQPGSELDQGTVSQDYCASKHLFDSALKLPLLPLQLMVYDVNTRHTDQIPSLQSSENSIPPETESGIHAIEINPSRNLLATGAKNANDLAVYQLPTLDPICVGEVSRGGLGVKTQHCLPLRLR